MSPNGAGSQRIVVIAAEGQPRAPAPRDVHPPSAPPAKQPAMGHGWTARRLGIAAALGAAAMLLGTGAFVWGFRVATDTFGSSTLVSMGFGLFVIGMVVLCAALIALLGTWISVTAGNSGWALAVSLVGVPFALAWAIYGVGAVGYAVPAVLSLLLISGLVVALR